MTRANGSKNKLLSSIKDENIVKRLIFIYTQGCKCFESKDLKLCRIALLASVNIQALESEDDCQDDE